jgi:AraC-like DNA-binding protein
MATILSDLLNAIRIGRSDWAIIELGAPGGLQFKRDDRAYVHFVLDGSVMLDGAGMQSPVALTTGSYAIVLNGQTHAVRDTQTAAATEARYFQDDHALDTPPVLRFGGAGKVTRILTGTLEVARAGGNPITRGLPNILLGKRDNATPTGPDGFHLEPRAVERGAMGPGGMAFLGIVGDMLLIQAVRSAVVSLSPTGKSAADIFGAPQINTALRLIDMKPEKNWSVSSLASEVGMSRSVFAAVFRQSVGEPPMQYVTSVRITRSGQLLKSSTLSVAKIAQKVGYGSVSSFARAFKKQYGATPGAYRRSARGTVHRMRPVAVQFDPFLS